MQFKDLRYKPKCHLKTTINNSGQLISQMGKYVLLVRWTDQGLKNVKDTIKRAESFKSYLEKKGGKLTDILYTFGKFDIVITAELPSDEVAMSVSLSTGALGNVRITTLKAFDLEETRKIIDGLK